MKSQNVSEPVMATPEQIAEIEKTIAEALPQIWASLTKDDAQSLIGNKAEFNAGIRRAFEPFIKTKVVSYWLDEMARFYKEVFGLDADYSDLQVPISRDGFGWLLVVDERVTAEMAFQKCRERFPSWKYTDQSLDEAVPEEIQKTHAIWLRETVEADEIHKNKSANQLERANTNSITLRARILLELWYHWKTGQHLDIQCWTLCAGSRDSDGDVPRCRWRDGKFGVDWCGPVDAVGDLRVREVVS